MYELFPTLPADSAFYLLKVGWIKEFNATFAQVGPKRQAGTTVMR